MRILGLSLLLALLGSTRHVCALDNGLALTPPMGWNSWNKFGANISETLIKQIADAMVTNGLQEAGYEYINIDDSWQITRDTNGVIVADATRFPNGIKAVADYVHTKGLKLGLYSDRGTQTCLGRPGAKGHEVQDANTYAEWGIDYLKYDNCSAAANTMEADYERMRDALLNSGRPMVYSICAWQFQKWMPACGNLWRTTMDIKDNWQSMVGIIDVNGNLAAYAGPGHWNDPDMLEVGNCGMSINEYRAHFSLWCVMAAPLILGNDLRNVPSAIIDIVANCEAIEVDQDAAGIQGTRVKKSGNLEVWCKPLGGTNGGTKAVVLLNRGTVVTNVVANWSDIGLSGGATVRDLWAHEDLGAFSGAFSASVPAHSVVMIKATLISLPRLEIVENALPLHFRAYHVVDRKVVVEGSSDRGCR